MTFLKPASAHHPASMARLAGPSMPQIIQFHFAVDVSEAGMLVLRMLLSENQAPISPKMEMPAAGIALRFPSQMSSGG